MSYFSLLFHIECIHRNYNSLKISFKGTPRLRMSTEIKSKKESKLYNLLNLVSYKAGVDLFKQIQESGVIVFGASGEMGSKISCTFPRASVKALMQDIDETKLQESRKNAYETLLKALSRKKLSKKQMEIINEKKLLDEIVVFPEGGKIPLSGIESFLDKVFGINVSTRNSYSSSMMVLEAGPEIPGFKKNVFKFFRSALVSPNAILATNTSSLKIDDVGADIGFHYFLPADRNQLIEIIVGSQTSLETIQAMLCLVTAMGKKSIICWKDSPGAVVNRILVGILNEAARIYDEYGFKVSLIDKVFLEVFYSRQITVQTKKVKRQFQAAPKLSFFMDEKDSYTKLKQFDYLISTCKNEEELEKLKESKKELLENTEGKLRQKVLYAQIVENLAPLGSFFTPSSIVTKTKTIIQEQINKLRNYSLSKENIEPYDFPPPRIGNEKRTLVNKKQIEEIIRDRLRGAYISISQEIYKEGLATTGDIELACKEGFKWNTGPFELIGILGKDKVEYLMTLINLELDKNTKTGISRAIIEVSKNDLSGIQTYIQDNIAFITIGRLHIQNLQMTQNSISPLMLEAIQDAVNDCVSKKVKAIIFKSQGGGAFSSGADLNYIESIKWDINKIIEFINLGKKVMNEIENCKIPTVAILDGAAVGGGLELALACDYRIMTDLSFISMPEVGLGIIPDWGGTERLPRIVGKELAKRLICTATLKNLGLKLNSEDAYLLGLADGYVLQSELPVFISKLIQKEISDIDIYTKPQKKLNFNKSDYPEHIVKRFNLDRPFKHNFRLLTRQAAVFAGDLINHSDDIEYSKRVNNDNASIWIFKSGKRMADICIKPFICIAQNKFLAPMFEALRML